MFATKYEEDLFKNRYARVGNEKTWNDVFKRVSNYVTTDLARQELYYDLMADALFIPSSPQLSNYGVPGEEAGSSCYTCEIDDTLESIWLADTTARDIYKASGGAGFNLSKIRPRGSKIGNSPNPSVGVMSAIERLNLTTKYITAGGRSRGALMVQLDVSHPDIIEFILAKRPIARNNTEFDLPLTQCNMSVRCSDKFMQAIEQDKEWTLNWNNEHEEAGNPTQFFSVETWGEYKGIWERTLNEVADPQGAFFYYKTLLPAIQNYSGIIKAKQIWKLIINNAWNHADPGIVFSDEYVRRNTTPNKGAALSNPCQPAFAPVISKTKGLCTFSDIDIGDQIWSKEGWTTVIAKQETGIKEVLKYRGSKGIFYGTKEHQIVENRNKIEVDKAKTIDCIAGPPTEIEPLNPQDIMDGLMLGDGSFAQGAYRVLNIGDKDQDYFSDPDIAPLIKHYHDIKQFQVHTTLIKEDFQKMWNRVIPNRFFENKTKIRGFLRGLYSANGTCLEKYRRITFKSTSVELIEDIQIALSWLGIRSYRTTNKPFESTFSNGTYLCKQSYEVNITTDKRLFRDLIGFIQVYKQEWLDSACQKKSPNRNPSGSILSKESLGRMPVYDITVDNDTHTYWSGGCDVSNCSEFIAPPNDACNLGSIDLTKFGSLSTQGDVDLLANTIEAAVWYLNESLNINKIPIESIDQGNKASRRIGLGVMGLHDYLILNGLAYDSDEGQSKAAILIAIIESTGWHTSYQIAEKMEWHSATVDNDILAKRFGEYADICYQNTIKSDDRQIWADLRESFLTLKYYAQENRPVANASITSIAPTGSIAQIAGFIKGHQGVSSGIEPVYDWGLQRRDHNGIVKINHWTADIAKEKNLTKTANQISWQNHIMMLAAVCQFTSLSVSKTINLPESATEKDVSEAYWMAWTLEIPGTTVYRNNSKPFQVLSSTSDLKAVDAPVSHPVEQPVPPHTIESKSRPDSLQGFTMKVPVHLGEKNKNIYITVNESNGRPYEVFFAGLNKDDLQDGVARELATVGRLVSMAMRYGVPTEEIIDQLEKIDGQHLFSLPIKLAKILSRFVDKDSEGNARLHCKQCGKVTPHQMIDGCKTCKVCGYSAC